MGNLSKRLERLEGGGGCDECRITPDTEFKINVTVCEVDENGRPIPPSPKPPPKCPACGKPLPVIRLRGLDEKTRGAPPE